jgi:IS30 family transposase
LQYKQIACRVGRDPSVISREVARHGGRNAYRAAAADEAAGVTRQRPKRFAVERSLRLRLVCQLWRWIARRTVSAPVSCFAEQASEVCAPHGVLGPQR